MKERYVIAGELCAGVVLAACLVNAIGLLSALVLIGSVLVLFGMQFVRTR